MFQVSFGDGLPNCICHRCLFKIEFCLEFRQQCILSDATLRQINDLSSKNVQENMLTNQLDGDVIMVVDPTTLDYDTEYETDANEHVSDNDISEFNDFYKNVFMCKFCDQAFTDFENCTAHEQSAHDSKVPYSCKSCSMNFGERLQYSAHLKSIHQNDKPYNCPECDKIFARRSDLRKHTVVHTGIKPFTCNVCYKSFSRNTNLSKHMRIHLGQKPFICTKCPKTFIHKGDLTRHTLVHSGVKPFACNYCHLSFGRRDKLFRHVKRHFPLKNSNDTKEKNSIERENFEIYNSSNPGYDNDEEPNEKVEQLWMSSENLVINIDPFTNHSFNNNEVLNEIKNESSDNTTINDHDLPKVPDHMMDKFSTRSQTTEDLPHIPEHITGDSLSSSVTHNIQTIKKEFNFSCLICNKKLSNPDSLKTHTLSHSGDRPHECQVCQKTFLRKRELDRHLATHTGMKPFRCTSCDKRFGRKDKLVRHMRTHSVEREHTCVICNSSFNRRDTLAQHMKNHSKDEEHK